MNTEKLEQQTQISLQFMQCLVDLQGLIVKAHRAKDVNGHLGYEQLMWNRINQALSKYDEIMGDKDKAPAIDHTDLQQLNAA